MRDNLKVVVSTVMVNGNVLAVVKNMKDSSKITRKKALECQSKTVSFTADYLQRIDQMALDNSSAARKIPHSPEKKTQGP